MTNFLDTSVLVATFYANHQHHEPSLDLFVKQKKATAATAAHCLAEVYAVLTGVPGKNRASPQEALLFLQDIRQRLSTVALTEEEYFDLIEDAVAKGLTGGAVYDAVIGCCALKADARAIYTWNTRHFSQLGKDIVARVREPQ